MPSKMVLCKYLIIGDVKHYAFRGVYLGRFVGAEQKVIGYDRDGPPNIQTVYTFEHPWKPSANPLDHVPSLYADHDVTEVVD